MIEISSEVKRLKNKIWEHACLARQENIFEAIYQINQLHDQLQSRIIESILDANQQAGVRGPIPSFCWIEMGSGGRQERTLWTDQDNGLIYHFSENEQTGIENCLKKNAMQVIERLAHFGYSLCQGGVMADHPMWLQSMQGWEQNLKHWSQELTINSIRYLLIASDMRPIYGEKKWAEELKRLLINKVRPQITRLVHYSLNQHIPIGVFGQIFTPQYGQHRGEIHIKEGGYYQLVSLVRALSLHAGIYESSTLRRLYSLRKHGYLSNKEATDLEEALAFFLFARLQLHRELSRKAKPLHDYISLSEWGKSWAKQLRQHLLNLKKQQKRWKKEFPREGGEML